MDKKTVDRITTTLGDSSDSYYVYMLCDSKTHLPFYIGKGKGGRVWQHEETLSGINKTIKGLEKQLQDNSLKESKKDSLEKEIALLREERENFTPVKIKRINFLKSENRFEKVIIKWGLTEHEAFMVESALINMYFFMNNTNSEENLNVSDNDKVLTNIVNGHMSTREKENISHETKARTVEQFLNDCAIEQYSVCSIRDNVEFVFIRDTWQECKESAVLKKDEKKQKFAIMECARAAWPMSDKVLENAEQIKYVFALYKSQVVGTYKLLDKPIRRCELSDQYIEKKFPEYPEKSRKNEKIYTKYCAKLKSFEDAVTICKSPDNNLDETVLCEVIGINNKTKDKDRAFQNWKNRIFFELEEVVLPEFKDKKLLLIPTTGNPDDLNNARKFNVGDVRNFKVSKKSFFLKSPSDYQKND